jgi:hypothetical protein
MCYHFHKELNTCKLTMEDLKVKVNSFYCPYFLQRNLIKMKCTLLSWMFFPYLSEDVLNICVYVFVLLCVTQVVYLIFVI